MIIDSGTTLIRKFSLMLASVLIFIFFVELGSTIILKMNGKLASVQENFIYKQINKNGSFAPNKDYVLPIAENNVFTWTEREFSVQVRTNSFGLREDFEVKLQDIETAFFGDSFTFGHGVESRERYSSVYSSYFGDQREKIVNFSYKNGFQPEHYEFYLKNNQNLRPRNVIVGLYLGNDLGSDLLETKYEPSSNTLELPYRRIFLKGQIANSPTAFKFPLNLLADQSKFVQLFLKITGKTLFRKYLFANDFEGPNSINSVSLEQGNVQLLENRAVKSLLRIQDLVQDRGGKLTVLVIPQNYFFTDVNPHLNPILVSQLINLRGENNLANKIVNTCRKINLDCFDARQHLDRESYFMYDGHWNARGHKEIGDALFQYLNN